MGEEGDYWGSKLIRISRDKFISIAIANKTSTCPRSFLYNQKIPKDSWCTVRNSVYNGLVLYRLHLNTRILQVAWFKLYLSFDLTELYPSIKISFAVNHFSHWAKKHSLAATPLFRTSHPSLHITRFPNSVSQEIVSPLKQQKSTLLHQTSAKYPYAKLGK